MTPRLLDLSRLRVQPLAARASLTRADDILLDPASPPRPCPQPAAEAALQCAQRMREARKAGAALALLYGAHLLRSGAAPLLGWMMAQGWLTHLATNGAGAIHDWEYAWLGASTESVEQGVASGTFGLWDETSAYLHLAVMAGALDGLGFGQSVGRFIAEDGVDLPSPEDLEKAIAESPGHPLASARADLLRAMRARPWPAERCQAVHRWKHASILAQAWSHGVPATVHPGIGYDIISNHPLFCGSALGRGAEVDFRLLGGSLERMSGGVTLSIGSAVMGPQVYEKALSCVNNLRLQQGLEVVSGHSIFVVDLQDGGGWDWSKGEPPRTNPAYYLRFCKSYSRMGGWMRYVQCDNAAFLHTLCHELAREVS
jgi:hypothetical protein